MNAGYFKRRAGLALLRRPWASRMVLAWGIGRALKLPRAATRWTFLGGMGLGAGLMYLFRGNGASEPAKPSASRAREHAQKRTSAASARRTPARRAAASRTSRTAN